MAAKSTTLDGQLLALLLNGTAITGLAINATSSPLTVLWMALHNTTLTASSNQSSGETAFTSYARTSVARTTAGFTVSGAVATLAANVTFPTCTGGTDTLTYWSLGTASSGAGEIMYWAPLPYSVAVANGVTVIIAAGTTITEA